MSLDFPHHAAAAVPGLKISMSAKFSKMPCHSFAHEEVFQMGVLELTSNTAKETGDRFETLLGTVVITLEISIDLTQVIVGCYSDP
jgi:hypothetical protein